MQFDLYSARADLQSGAGSATEFSRKSLEAAASPACRQAFITVDASALQAAAQQADADRVRGTPASPLSGLSVSVKDLFDVAGQVSRAGSRLLADAAPALRDSISVARLRQAGAGLVGRTNMTEFAFSGLGINPHLGTPENAAMARLGLPGRIPGGSSSGAAVSVAAGAAWAALGSDTGGSIRIPAALHGLVGYKNTQHLTSNEGCLPLSASLDTSCAITRSVRDAIVLHEVLAGRRVPINLADPVGPDALAGLRLGIAQNFGLDDLEPAVAAAFQRALRCLQDAGAALIERDLAPLADLPSLLINGGIVCAEAWRWHAPHLAQHEAVYDPRVASRIRRGEATSDAALAALQAQRAGWIDTMQAAMSDVDVWLMPTVPLLAPLIDAVSASDDEYFRVNGLMLRNPTLVNLLDGCAISLPCQAVGNAPVGLMAWAARDQDDKLLAAALKIEAALTAAQLG